MTPTSSVSLRYLVLRYLVVSILTALLLFVVFMALEFFFGFSSSSGGSIAVAIVPALDSGATFARRNKRVPTKAESWRISAILFGVHLLFGLALLGAIGMIMDTALLTPLFSMLSAGIGTWVVVVIFAIYFLAMRFFFGSGANGEVRRAERLADQGK